MKKKLLKILSTLIIIVMISNQLSCVFADTVNKSLWTLPDNGSVAENIGSGLIGFFVLIVPKYVVFVLPGMLIEGILELLMFDSLSISNTPSPADILFNRVSLLKLDFFNSTNSSGDSTLELIKTNVKKWYNAIRNIAIGAELIIIVYIGIRMALSTLADDKAKYKRLLRFWIESFVLLFMLQYIMVLVIELNNEIVKIFENAEINATAYTNNGTSVLGGSIIDDLRGSIKDISISGFAASIGYFMFMIMTLIFYVMYLKRLVVIAFLIIIAPLITISYSIDKVGDGKSQALSSWLKQFMYNILIQPFHCVLYLVFGSIAYEVIDAATVGTGFKAIFLLVFILIFIWKAEKIVKEIFGFSAADSTLMGGLAAGAMLGKAKDIGKQGIKNLNSGRKAIGNIKLKGGKRIKDGKTGKWLFDTKNAFYDTKVGSKVKQIDENVSPVINAFGLNKAGDKTRTFLATSMITGEIASGFGAIMNSNDSSSASSISKAETKKEEEYDHIMQTAYENPNASEHLPDVKTNDEMNRFMVAAENFGNSVIRNIRSELEKAKIISSDGTINNRVDMNSKVTEMINTAMQQLEADTPKGLDVTFPAGFLQDISLQIMSSKNFNDVNINNMVSNLGFAAIEKSRADFSGSNQHEMNENIANGKKKIQEQIKKLNA